MIWLWLILGWLILSVVTSSIFTIGAIRFVMREPTPEPKTPSAEILDFTKYKRRR